MRPGAKFNRKYRILIADRAGVFRLGLKKLFAVEDDFRVVAQADNAVQVPELAKRFQPDLLFIQYEIAREGSGDLVARTRQAVPHGRIIVMGDAISDDEVRELVRRGAVGVVPKSATAESFVKCAATVTKDGSFLPKPQTEESSPTGAVEARARPVDTLTRREKSIIGSLSHVWDEDFRIALGLLGRGAVQATPLITDRIPLSAAVSGGLALLRDEPGKHVKILVQPGHPG